MTGVVVDDTNLMVLLVVGSASNEYIPKHKCLQQDYSVDDFDLLGLLIAEILRDSYHATYPCGSFEFSSTTQEPSASKSPKRFENINYNCY